MLPLFNIEDDCNTNNGDNNYLILNPYYLLDSVLMLLYVILFLEIPDPSGIYLWQFSIVKNFLSLLYRRVQLLSSHNTGKLEYCNVRSKMSLKVGYTHDFKTFLAIRSW